MQFDTLIANCNERHIKLCRDRYYYYYYYYNHCYHNYIYSRDYIETLDEGCSDVSPFLRWYIYRQVIRFIRMKCLVINEILSALIICLSRHNPNKPWVNPLSNTAHTFRKPSFIFLVRLLFLFFLSFFFFFFWFGSIVNRESFTFSLRFCSYFSSKGKYKPYIRATRNVINLSAQGNLDKRQQTNSLRRKANKSYKRKTFRLFCGIWRSMKDRIWFFSARDDISQGTRRRRNNNNNKKNILKKKTRSRGEEREPNLSAGDIIGTLSFVILLRLREGQKSIWFFTMHKERDPSTLLRHENHRTRRVPYRPLCHLVCRLYIHWEPPIKISMSY